MLFAVPAVYLVLGFLGTAAFISAAAARARVPYPAALVVAGLAAGALRIAPPLHVDPDVLVVALIVPLLFEGALRIPRAHLRTYAPLLGALAIPGTVISAAVIAGAARLAGVPWHGALLLGAIGAATDPAGVIALVRETRLDARLGTVLEGEAVANDAVAIVLFGLAAAAWPGAARAAADFAWLLVGGAAAGAAAGAAVAYGLAGISEPVVEAIGSFLAAAGAYAAAQAVGGSGVIGVVAAGLVFAAQAGRSLTAEGAETVRVVWDVIAFLANSALFLLIGLLVPVSLLARYAGLIALVAVAALAGRAIIVYGFAAALARVSAPFPAAWRHILVWGGLRGGVAVALVLALPASLMQRDAVAAGVLGLVVWTLVGQWLLIGPVARWTSGTPSPGAGESG